MRQLMFFVALTIVAAIGYPAAAAQRAPLAAAPAIAAPEWSGGIIGALGPVATIGSTVDPLNGDQNPYGLTISPAGGGAINQGDLVICNFNDAANIQGLGTTIDLLSPVPGSKPRHLIADPHLTGCAAIAMGSSAPWIAALDANDNPIVSGGGQLVSPINNFAWTAPGAKPLSPDPRARPRFTRATPMTAASCASISAYVHV